MLEEQTRSELAIAANLVGRLIGVAREAQSALAAAVSAGDDANARAEALAKANSYASRLAPKVAHTHLTNTAQAVIADLEAGSIAAAQKGLADMIARLARMQHAPCEFVGLD